jgi:serine/threonine protein kinase
MIDSEVTGQGLGGSCPDAEELVELARGRLSDDKRTVVLSHIRCCTECEEVLRLWTRAQGGSSVLSGGVSAEETTGDRDAVKPRYPPARGDVLSGKYRVDRILGIGGMGVVVAATHLALDRPVALKLMLPESASSAETTARFIQEARAAADVQSEHVVRVLDVGSLEDGAPFLVMEYLRGSDFARLLRTHGPLPLPDVAGYILQACEAVAEAHALGIVHRDLKPANLFLTTRADGSPLVKVLDFGISKLTRSGARRASSLTKSRSILGTPLYMSPEQLRSTRTVGPATDIWSLGCILYELLAGRPAFFAESAEALGALIATGPTPRIRDVRPEVPGRFEEVIVRCLEKDPEDRIRSIGELAKAIGPFAPADLGSLVVRVGRISTRAPEELPFAKTESSEHPPRFAATAAGLARSGQGTRHRRGSPLWLAGGALVLGLAWLTLTRGGGSSSVEVPIPSATAFGSGAAVAIPAPIQAPSAAASVGDEPADASSLSLGPLDGAKAETTPVPSLGGSSSTPKPEAPPKPPTTQRPRIAPPPPSGTSKDRDSIE